MAKISRRKFLTGLGTGAAAGALSLPEKAIGAVVNPHPQYQSSNRNFSRMFPTLPAFAPATGTTGQRVKDALLDISGFGGMMDAKDPLGRPPSELITDPAASANNPDNSNMTAGATFMGQFFDHDMTFDTTSLLGVPKAPEQSPNTRTPGFDLDSVYGLGPSGSSQLYNPADRAKLRIESTGLFEDIPRASDGTAIIADPRNDENMMIAGLQAAFIKFHNNVVDRLRGQGVPATSVFTEAQRLTRWHYQWLILKEFLPLFIGQNRVDAILANGRRFYRPAAGQHAIPVEFQGAVYRFGHSMIRPSYRGNFTGNPGGTQFFGMIFDPAGEGQADPVDLRGGARARRRFIGWPTFFDFGDGNVRRNKIIDTRLSTALFRLPLNTIAGTELSVTSLPQRNLLRHITWSLPSGQAIAQLAGLPSLGASNFPELRGYNVGLDSSTPLFYYILREAHVMEGGLRLGPVGSLVVGEVFIGLLQLDNSSFLRTNPTWRPTLPQRNNQVTGNFTMVDFLTFAGVAGVR